MYIREKRQTVPAIGLYGEIELTSSDKAFT